MKCDYYAQMQQWRGRHLLRIKKTKREELKDDTGDACFTFFLFNPSMVCIVFLPQLHWCWKSTFVNILLTSQVQILEFLTGPIRRTWIAGGREAAKGHRSNLGSGKCVQHVRVSLNEAKNSHMQKTNKINKTSTLLGKDVSDHFGHSFCNYFRSPGGTYSTLLIRRGVLVRSYRSSFSSETPSWTWFPAFQGAVYKSL